MPMSGPDAVGGGFEAGLPGWLREPARPVDAAAWGLDETIAGLLTPVGESAIAVIVVDGPEARAVMEHAAPAARRHLVPGKIVTATLGDEGRPVDEVVFSLLEAEKSPTGRERLEVNCHGGAGVIEAVMGVLVACGCRLARMGELVAREHLAGKLSLIGVEARLLQVRGGWTVRQQRLLASWARWEGCLQRLAMRLLMEGRSGSPEGPTVAGVGLKPPAESPVELAVADPSRQAPLEELAELLRRGEQALRALAGHRVVLLGPPNTGKSSLFNLLCGAPRSLVAEVPGTTRDVVRAFLDLEGLSVELFDTPALGPNGVDEALQPQAREIRQGLLAGADAVVLVIDGSREMTEKELAELPAREGKGTILCLNKSDLSRGDPRPAQLVSGAGQVVFTSTRTKEGLAELRAALGQALYGEGPPPEHLAGSAPFSPRQVRKLRELREALRSERLKLVAMNGFRRLLGLRPDPEALAEILQGAGADWCPSP